MHRTVRALVALWITLIVSLLGAAGIASAQEMEHGRTRPTLRAAPTNQVKTQNAIMTSYAGYIRG